MTAGRKKIYLAIFCGCVLLLLLCSCLSGREYSKESKPRSDQANWVNEEILQIGVVRLLGSARLASREPGIVEKYAGMLRYWYGIASGNGSDVDGGIRALNYLKVVHFSRQGDKLLWEQALKAAKKTDTSKEGLAARPIPADYN